LEIDWLIASLQWIAGLVTTAAVVMAVGGNAIAQQPVPAGISDGDCKAFRHYILQEARDFGTRMSGTFLTAASRFTKAACVARDQDGEIQLITETTQDAVSFGTVLDRMGKVDVLGASGVLHCHRPPNGLCPASSASRRAGGR
jgi:hypothetical protein